MSLSPLSRPPTPSSPPSGHPLPQVTRVNAHHPSHPRLQLSGFGTVDHEVHRRRREGLRKFFSKPAVARIERDLHGLAQQLGDKILASGGEVFVFQDAMSCFTSDGIGMHSFGDPLGFLQQRSFLPNLKRSSQPIFTTFYVFRWLGLARYIFARFGA